MGLHKQRLLDADNGVNKIIITLPGFEFNALSLHRDLLLIYRPYLLYIRSFVFEWVIFLFAKSNGALFIYLGISADG